MISDGGIDYLLPPDVPNTPISFLSREIFPFNRTLNHRQLLAVSNIVNRMTTSIPYIIFGPPGTGKTSTLVEAIKQYGRLNPDKKVLVCAPSNDAANVILTRLSSSIPVSEMFRFLSYQISPSSVQPQDVLKYCNFVHDGFSFPTMSNFLQYRYVVCTCSMAAKLTNNGVPRGHFSAVFIDEAGHATEPETVSCFSTLASGNSTHIVLAGDPMQLGPVIRSANAIKGKLGMSMLERFLRGGASKLFLRDTNVFPETDGYDPKFVTKLNECYRCHPEILRVPNELFYEGELIARADPAASRMFLGWDMLCNPVVPLIFHGMQGEHMREGNSPSWFNPYEVDQVVAYCLSLVGFRGLSPQQIGVIAPYRKQVEKIRVALKSKGPSFENITVGSCEQFQGQERQVIIISTVRSSTDFDDQDKFFNLGFISNPKRFNVAVTRAKGLLIVVGNPRILGSDPCWGRFLTHCQEQTSYRGFDFDQSVASLVEQLQDCILTDAEHVEDEDEEGDGGDVSADDENV